MKWFFGAMVLAWGLASAWFYFKTETNMIVVKKVTMTKPLVENKKDMIFKLHKLNTDLSLHRIANIQEIKVGSCLVQFRDCAFVPDKNPKWRSSICAQSMFDSSYQIVDIDPKAQMALTVYWYGMGYPTLVGTNSKELKFDWEEKYGWVSDKKPQNNWYQGNCGEIQQYALELQEKYAQMQPPIPQPQEQESFTKPYKPLFEKGQCIVSASSCFSEDERESWETNCHPVQDSYKIKQVGKRNYLVEYWYGYVDDDHDLLGQEQTVSFQLIDNPNQFQVENCTTLKKKFPKGNYSAVFQKRLRRPANK